MDPRQKQEQIGLFPATLSTPDAAGVEAIIIEARRTRDAALADRVRRGFTFLRRAIVAVGQAVFSWPQRRATYQRLHDLSDRELSDIGLTRGEISRVFDPDFRIPTRPANANAPAPGRVQAA